MFRAGGLIPSGTRLPSGQLLSGIFRWPFGETEPVTVRFRMADIKTRLDRVGAACDAIEFDWPRRDS